MRQSVYDKKIYHDIRRYGSPTYTVKLPSIAATAAYGISVDDYWPASRRYKPLTTLEVVNNDVVDIEILVNGNVKLFIPHTSQKAWDDLPMQELIITNQSTTTASTINLIMLSLLRPPVDQDQIARERHG